MAAGIDFALGAELSNNLQLLTCYVCTNPMTSPKLLPCSHTFCEQCLELWVGKNQGKLPCPVCREMCPMPPQGVKGLRNNQFVEGLLEIFSKRETEAVMRSCETCRQPAVVWCVDCCQFFCQDCRRSHEIVRSLSTHRLLTMEEYNSVDAPRACQAHPGSLLELFCDRCQATLCRKCAEENHGGAYHEVVPVEEAVRKYLPLLKNYAFQADTLMTSLKNDEELLESTVDDLKKQEREITDRVSAEAAEAIRKIKEEEERLLQEAARISGEKKSQARIGLEAIKLDIERMKNVQTYTSDLLQTGNRCDVLNRKKALDEGFEHVKQAAASLQRKIPPQAVLKFEINDSFFAGSTAMGSISCEERPQVFTQADDVDALPKSGEPSQSTPGQPANRTKDSNTTVTCQICHCEVHRRKTLPCSHTFCANCIDLEFGGQTNGSFCPQCGYEIHPVMKFGKMPKGTFDHRLDQSLVLPGYPRNTGCIVIEYHFPGGIQGEGDPSPGNKYRRATFMAYLPATDEGKEVRKLLHTAFKRKLTFTIGTSRDGTPDCIIWNGIDHKTSTTGGPERNGYPDPGYLRRVKKQLAANGVNL